MHQIAAKRGQLTAAAATTACGTKLHWQRARARVALDAALAALRGDPESEQRPHDHAAPGRAQLRSAWTWPVPLCVTPARLHLLHLLVTSDAATETIKTAVERMTEGLDAQHARWRVDAPDAYGHTPLHLAAARGRLEPLKVLLRHGADVRG